MKIRYVLAVKETNIFGSQLIVLKCLLGGKMRKLKAVTKW